MQVFSHRLRPESVPNSLSSGTWAALIRLCSRRWWDSGAWSPELCTLGVHIHSHAHNDGRSCFQRAAEERQHRCGPSHCCRCWCCPASPQPKCWGTPRLTAGYLGHSDGDGASTARPAELWWPEERSQSLRQPKSTVLAQGHRCHWGLFVPFLSLRLSWETEEGQRKGQRKWDESVNRDRRHRDLKKNTLSLCPGGADPSEYVLIFSVALLDSIVPFCGTEGRFE